MVEGAGLAADSDAGVVTNLLAQSGGKVEEGGLAAVGVAHEGDGDLFAAFLHLMGDVLLDGAVEHVVGVGVSLKGDDLDVGCLAASERDMTAHDAIFHGVEEWGVLDHIDNLSTHEAELHDAMTEAAVTMDLEDHAPRMLFHLGEQDARFVKILCIDIFQCCFFSICFHTVKVVGCSLSGNPYFWVFSFTALP